MSTFFEHERPALSRDAFREGCLERDGHACVMCGRSDRPLDVHHILERRLFEQGGYFLENGATLCSDREEGCHTTAERTLVTPEDLREMCGIQDVALPRQLYAEFSYTKWGDIVHEDGTRAPGPLFYDPSVQAILKEGGVLWRYSDRVKYPRTFHLPNSPGMQKDDMRMASTDHWNSENIVVSVKLDGANTTIYHDGLHGRSVRGKAQPEQSFVRGLQPTLNLGPGLRLVAENLQAAHTLTYTGLRSYVYGLSLWEQNTCLAHGETADLMDVLGLPMPEVLYAGPYLGGDHLDRLAREITAPRCGETGQTTPGHEGLVVRVERAFSLREMPLCVGKYVNAEFAQQRDRHGHNFQRQAPRPNHLGSGPLMLAWTHPPENPTS